MAGQKYYYNTKTNETRWERPRGAAPAAAEDSPENHVPTANGDVSSAAINGSKFKKCLGCQGWGRGLVQAWNYCNHCTRFESFMILTHIRMDKLYGDHCLPLHFLLLFTCVRPALFNRKNKQT